MEQSGNKDRNYLVVIVILIVVLLITMKSCERQKSKVESQSQLISLMDSSYQKSLKSWKDKEGHQHLTISQLQLDKEELSKLVEKQAKLLGIKSKNIRSVTTLTTEVIVDKGLKVDTLEKIVYVDSVHMDTLRQFNFHYNDKWAKVNGSIGDSITQKDTINIYLTDTITTTTYLKKRWFKPDLRMIDVSNVNPYVHLGSLKSLELKEPKPKTLAIGLTLGVGYSTSNAIMRNPYPQLQVGISIIYLPLSIKIH